MSENDHPKVIVDDDFLDLRNPQSKTFSKRPTSAQSNTKDSSSTHTRERPSSSREGLPGLQRLLGTYNQKNIGNFRFNRPFGGKNVQIDNRFRRKVEKSDSSSESTSILHEREKSVEGKNERSNSSEETPSTASSSSGKKSELTLEQQPSDTGVKPIRRLPKIESQKVRELTLEQQPSDPVVKPIRRLPKIEPEKVREEVNIKSLRETKTSNLLKDKLEDDIKPKSNRQKKPVKDEPPIGIKPLGAGNEISLKKSSTPIKKTREEFEHSPPVVETNDAGDNRKSSTEASSSGTKQKKDKFENLINDEKFKNEKLFGMEENSYKEYKRPTTGSIIKDLVLECRDITSRLQKLKWYDPTVLIPHSLHSIPGFKKSWTIPSFPLIKREVFWARHYNVLCEKEDRKTYKFDLDDTISIESIDKSRSQCCSRNYMNLIFCLGCLCGIFLVAGVLTASEIQVNLHRSDDSKIALFELLFKEILYTFDIILDGFLQVLTFPISFFKKKEASKSWAIF